MKRTRFAALLAASILTATTLFSGQVAYADAQNIDGDVELTQSMFMEKRTVPAWLLTELGELEDKTITLQADFYSVSFNSKTVGTVPDDVIRYDLTVKRKKKDIEAFDNAVGEETPKYVLEIPQEQFPGVATITLTNSSFMPSSQVHVYRYIDDMHFQVVKKFIPVEENGDVSFDITQGGTYLVTPRQISENFDRWNFDREPINDVDSLLTYLNDDSVYDFSGLMESLDQDLDQDLNQDLNK